MQKGFWALSALGLVLAVVGGGWVLYQRLVPTTPTVLKKSGDSITAPTSPHFNVSTMAADSYFTPTRTFWTLITKATWPRGCM